MDVTQQMLYRLGTAYRARRPLALLFDYDGTLVPIVAHPSLAVLPLPLRELLEQLTRQPRVALGFLSGRGLDDLKALVGLPNAYYVGTAGLQVDLRGTVQTPDASSYGRTLITDLLKPLQGIVADFPGAWVENKGLAVAIHYRAVEAALSPLLQEKVGGLLHPMRRRLRVVPGPMALEISPDVGWNKGTALRTIVAHVGPTTFPFYAGDAANDAEALTAALDLGGIALWIGADPPAKCPLHLPAPADLAEFLALLLRQLTLCS